MGWMEEMSHVELGRSPFVTEVNVNHSLRNSLRDEMR